MGPITYLQLWPKQYIFVLIFCEISEKSENPSTLTMNFQPKKNDSTMEDIFLTIAFFKLYSKLLLSVKKYIYKIKFNNHKT